MQNDRRPVPTWNRYGHQRRQNPVVCIWDCHNPSPPFHSGKIPLQGTVHSGAVATIQLVWRFPIFSRFYQERLSNGSIKIVLRACINRAYKGVVRRMFLAIVCSSNSFSLAVTAPFLTKKPHSPPHTILKS